MNYLFYTLLVFVTIACQGIGAKESTDAHVNHSRVGSHGMVLFTDGEGLYASHLALYRAPHDAQIIYRIESEHTATLIDFLRAHNTGRGEAAVTLLPEVFDLNLLLSGQTVTLKTQFFDGHFERGGTPLVTDDSLTFAAPIMIKPLKINENEPHHWLRVTLQSGKSLYLHQINHRPSYDAMWVTERCDVSTAQAPQRMKEVPDVIQQCADATLFYLDNQDFQ